MSSLAQRDTSGTFTQNVVLGEGPEAITRRTRAFKVFPLPDAPDGRKRFRVGGSVGPIHYRLNPFSAVEQYKEIDLTIGAGRGCDLEMMANGYQIQCWHSRPNAVSAEEPLYVMRFLRAGHWVEVSPIALYYQNDLGQRQAVGALKGGVKAAVDNDAYSVRYADAFGPGLSLRYQLVPDEFYPVVEIASAAALPAPTIDPHGLRLVKLFSIRWDTDTDPVALTHADKLNPGELTLDKSKFDSAVKVEQTTAFPAEAVVDVAARTERRQAWWWKPPRCWDSSEEVQDVPTKWEWAENQGQFAVAVSVAVADLDHVIYPVYLDTTPIGEEQVGAQTDDAGAYGSTYPGTSTLLSLTQSYLYFGAGTSTFYMFGARFTTIPIPKDATIDSASLSLRSYTNSSVQLDITIAAEAADSAVTFDTVPTHSVVTAYNAKGAQSAQWDVGTAAWVTDGWYQSSDIAAVIEEVTDRAGWSSGNDLALIVYNTSSDRPGSSEYRRCHSYDQSGNVSGPKFNASYTEGGGADVTVFPAALTLTAAVQGPIPVITSSPSALALTAALPTPEPVVTSTPAALALTAAVLAPTETGTAVVEPSTLALVAALLAPEPTVISTPSPLAISAALGAPEPIITMMPSVLALTAAVEAPGVIAGAIVEPAAVPLTAALLTPEPVVTMTPAALALSIAVEAPEPTIIATPGALSLNAALEAAEPVVVTTPAALVLTGAVETPTTIAGAVVEPSVVSLTATVLAPEPTIITSPASLALTLALLDPEATVVVTPAALALALGIEAPVPVIIASATALALTLGLPVPVIIATTIGDVIVLPAALAMTLGLLVPDPQVSVQPNALALTATLEAPVPTIIIAPDALALVLNLETPVVTAGAVVLPATLALTLGLQTPAYAVIVTPVALSLTATVESPTVTATAIVLPVALALSLGLPSPVVVVVSSELMRQRRTLRITGSRIGTRQIL